MYSDSYVFDYILKKCKVNECYPYLVKYDNDWAVVDFLRMYLKNQVTASKKS